MITIKDRASINKMREAGVRLVEIFAQLPAIIQAGVTTAEIDAFIGAELDKRQMVSMTKGYHGYRHASCVSVNDVVVHGVPDKTKLAGGDLVKVDVCASYRGWCADMARPFIVGQGAQKVRDLVQVSQEALDAGIEMMQPGNRLSDVSHAIQKVVESYGYGVVRNFAGHGIGQQMHEDPEVLNYGRAGRGPLLRTGMVLAIEPMITIGDYATHIDADGWTARTDDGSIAAHIEDTVAVVEDGFEILTR